MTYVIGAILGLATCLLASYTRLDRGRAFYPVMMIVIAVVYAAFALVGGSPDALRAESIPIAIFIAAAIAGWRFSLWIIVAALIAHGIFDFIHDSLIANPGVPRWYPPVCGAYDIAAGLYLAWRSSQRRTSGGTTHE